MMDSYHAFFASWMTQVQARLKNVLYSLHLQRATYVPLLPCHRIIHLRGLLAIRQRLSRLGFVEKRRVL